MERLTVEAGTDTGLLDADPESVTILLGAEMEGAPLDAETEWMPDADTLLREVDGVMLPLDVETITLLDGITLPLEETAVPAELAELLTEEDGSAELLGDPDGIRLWLEGATVLPG